MALTVSFSNITQYNAGNPYVDFYSSLYPRKNYIAFIFKLPSEYTDGGVPTAIADPLTFFSSIQVDRNGNDNYISLGTLSSNYPFPDSYLTLNGSVYNINWTNLVNGLTVITEGVYYNATYGLIVKMIAIVSPGYVMGNKPIKISFVPDTVPENDIDILKFENVLIDAKPYETSCDSVQYLFGDLNDGVQEITFN